MEPTVRVTVAVLTYRRPQVLADHLPAVLDHAKRESGPPAQGRRRFEVNVLVVDNDPDRSASDVVAAPEFAGIRYCNEPVPGIAAARNRALDECSGADLMVFLDDDESPREGWLRSLLDTWLRTGAGVVCGKVAPEYEGELDPWIEAGKFFIRRNLPTGTVIHSAASGNVLLDLTQIRPTGVRFDPRYGLSGGEDTMFSRSLDRAGVPMVWCNESVATDRVPKERMTRRWVLTRAWSHGNTSGVAALDLSIGAIATARASAVGLLGGVGRALSGVAQWGMGTLTRSLRHQALGAQMACRGMGFVAGSLGFVYQEYSRGGAGSAGRRLVRRRSR